MDNSHYWGRAIHHLQVIKKEDDELTVFDLGITEGMGPCTCSIGHDHSILEYKLYRLEIFPSLQLAIAGWPCIGKIIRTFSWNKIKPNLINNFHYLS